MTAENPITETRRIQHVEMRNIVKRFPGVLANYKVSLDVQAGEVHALLGENGAGKSTLMRQLYGLYQPDEGEILIDGKPQVFHSPADAIRAGIGMIHQHFMLVPTLTVAQNVALGLRSSREPLLDLDKVTGRINALADAYGLKVDPRAYIWQLSVGEQQRVEIMKALYRGAGLIILDEPTAVLTPQEVNDLFTTLRRMVDEGHSLVFISHKLHEVMAISDRITVLRDGKMIGTRLTSEVTRDVLVKMMVGRELKQLEPRPRQPGPVMLKIEGLKTMGDRGAEALHGMDLETPGKSWDWRAYRAMDSASWPNAWRVCARPLPGRSPSGSRILLPARSTREWTRVWPISRKSVCGMAPFASSQWKKTYSCMIIPPLNMHAAFSSISGAWLHMQSIW